MAYPQPDPIAFAVAEPTKTYGSHKKPESSESKAPRKKPESSEALLSKAQFHRQSGHVEKAHELLEQALERNSRSLPALLEQGFWKLATESEGALAFFEKHRQETPHVLGFQLGHRRAQNGQAQTSDDFWHELETDFPTQGLLIGLSRLLL